MDISWVSDCSGICASIQTALGDSGLRAGLRSGNRWNDRFGALHAGQQEYLYPSGQRLKGQYGLCDADSENRFSYVRSEFLSIDYHSGSEQAADRLRRKRLAYRGIRHFQRLHRLRDDRYYEFLYPGTAANRQRQLGAKQFGRIRSLIKTGIGQSFVVLLVLQVLVMLFARPVVAFFAGGVQELIDITVHAMRLFILIYAFGNVATLVGGYYIGIEKMGLALLNSLTRVVIFAVPMLFIIPMFLGLDGVWLAQPIADVFACLIAVICMAHEIKRLKSMERRLDTTQEQRAKA